MRRFIARALIVGLSLVALAAPTLASIAPAGAAEPCPASCVAGEYSIHFKWANGERWNISALTLAADHTGSFSHGGLLVTWTKSHGVFTMSFDVDDGLITGSYVGFRNNHGGFNRRLEKGTMSNNEGNTGVWFARAATTP